MSASFVNARLGILNYAKKLRVIKSYILLK